MKMLKRSLLLITLISMFAIIGCSVQDDESVDEGVDVEDSEQLIRDEEMADVSVLFDIPYLLDKNISYFISEFGDPVNEDAEPTDFAIEMGEDTWAKVFERDGYSISVFYYIDTEDVYEISLINGTDDMPLEDTWFSSEEISSLLLRGNILGESGDYYYRFYLAPVSEKNLYTVVNVKSTPHIGYNGEELCNGYPEC